MMTKKKNQYNFLHHVDEEHKKVYVHVNSWAGSMGAQVRGKELFPGYEIVISSQDLVEYLNGEGN